MTATGATNTRPRGRGHVISALAEDELGQMTPIGAASAREGTHAPRGSLVGDPNAAEGGG